ncbi:MAG: CotH kinase family protein [Clostridiales bacterium]|jgi:hypothetical protein|nr:CotH kinase family protein [Clostridiales bacterium]
MRKIKLAALLCSALLTVIFISGCAVTRPPSGELPSGEPPAGEIPKTDKMNTPVGVRADSFYDEIVWDAVSDATGYVVNLNGQTFDAPKNIFSTASFTAGEYEVSVKATGGKADSDYSEAVTYINTKITSAEFEERFVTFTKDIPTLKIDTKDAAAITSKTDYVDATAQITNTKAEYLLSDWKIQIRGRGNSTWGQPKKPYRIKAEKKTAVFGFAKVKNWALLAEYSDKSFMRNYFAHMLARSLDGMSFSANCVYVELELNGRYDGLYLLTDQPETGESRVDAEGYTTDAVGRLTDTGFMLEIDDRATSDSTEVLGQTFFQIFPQRGGFRDHYNFVLKYPKADDDGFDGNPALYSQAFKFIKDYIQSVFDAIEFINNDGNYADFNRLCDENSFIDYWIIQELTKNTDADALSLFVNRKAGGKMSMGPVWDFDIGIGNAWYMSDALYPSGWYNRTKNIWFSRLMGNTGFKDNFKRRYDKLYEVQISHAIAALSAVETDIAAAVARNFSGDLVTRYRFMGKEVAWAQDVNPYSLGYYVWPSPEAVVQANTFAKQVKYVRDYLTDRALWMSNNL